MLQKFTLYRRATTEHLDCIELTGHSIDEVREYANDNIDDIQWEDNSTENDCQILTPDELRQLQAKQSFALTELEYSVLMNALQNAVDDHKGDTFIDEYERKNSDTDTTYQNITDALKTAEEKLRNHYTK